MNKLTTNTEFEIQKKNIEGVTEVELITITVKLVIKLVTQVYLQLNQALIAELTRMRRFYKRK